MKKNRIIFALSLIIVIISMSLMFYRCTKGVDLTDEVYGIAEIYNTALDKKPIIDIWDPHIGWFLYAPFLKLFKFVSPTLRGVVLYYRILYLSIAFLFLVLSHKLANRKKPFLLLFPCICFVPFSIPQLGYNAAVSYILVIAFCILLCESIDNRLRLFILGITMGVLYLIYPTTIATGFFLFLIFLSDKTYRRNAFSYLLGFCLVGVLFVGWITIGLSDFSHFWVGLKAIISTPHEANKGAINLSFLKITFLERLLVFFSNKRQLLWTGHLLLVFLIAWLPQDAVKNKKSILLLYEWCIFILLSVVETFLGGNIAAISRQGYICFDVFLSTVIFEILHWKLINKSSKYLLFLVCSWIITYCFTSDNKNLFFAIDAASVIIVFNTCIVLCEDYTVSYCTTTFHQFMIKIVIPTLMIFIGIVCFFGYVYRDSSVETLTRKVNEGIFCGLYTTESNADYVERLEHEMTETIECDKTVFVMNNVPAFYLMSHAKILAPQTWDAQFLARGYTSASPVIDYFKYKGIYPDYIIADNHIFIELYERKEIEFWGFIQNGYELFEEFNHGEHGITRIWKKTDK